MIDPANAPDERCHGFSLVELIVVLVLMALLAALVSLSLRGVVARQRLGTGLETVEQFDTTLRRQARRHRGRVTGLIDPSRRRLVVEDPTSPKREFQLPRSVSIDTIRRFNSGAARRTTRIASIGDGSTASYAVRLESGGAKRWVFFAGGSGQVVHGLDDASVALLLRSR